MAVELVRVDEVREHEHRARLVQEVVDGRYGRGVVGGVVVLADASAGEDLAHFAHRMHRHSRVLDVLEVGARGRGQGEVAPPRRAPERAGLAVERARDHSPDTMVALKDSPRARAVPVELLLGHAVYVCGNLEDGVLRGVDDQLARPEVALAVLLDGAQALGSGVADHPAAGRALELGDQLRREAVRIHREARHRYAHHLPVAGGGVLAGAERVEAAMDDRALGRLDAPYRGDAPEAELL